MIVLDASAAVRALLYDGDARSIVADEKIAIPHLADSEVTHALRRHVLTGQLPEVGARRALERWGTLGLSRFSAVAFLSRVWELRDNLSAYDALYVALAESAGCDLVTADRRIARAPGPRCAVRVVRD